MDLPPVGPSRRAGDEVELTQQSADDLVGVSGGAQMIQLLQHLTQRLFDVADRSFGVVLALFVETLLALHELFAVEG